VTVRPAHTQPVLNLAGARAGEAGEPRVFWRISNFVPAGAGRTCDIDLYGEIGVDRNPDTWEQVGVSAQTFLDQVRELGLTAADTLRMRVCSGGGNSMDAAAIYSVLVGLPCRKVGIVDGLAASAATIPLMACDEVQIPANAIFMIHDPMTGVFGNVAALGSAIETLGRVKSTIVAAYAAKNAKMSADEIAAAMALGGSEGTGTTYTGAEAVEAGFADTLIAPAPVVNFAALDPAALKGAPEDFVRAVEAQRAEAAATQEDAMNAEEIAKSFETLTASLANLTDSVAKLSAAPKVAEAQVENKVVVEKTPAERDAESLAKVKAFAEGQGAGILAVFNKYVEGGAPVEAVRTAVYGAAATADAHAAPQAAGKPTGKTAGTPLTGLTIENVADWYGRLNKRA